MNIPFDLSNTGDSSEVHTQVTLRWRYLYQSIKEVFINSLLRKHIRRKGKNLSDEVLKESFIHRISMK